MKTTWSSYSASLPEKMSRHLVKRGRGGDKHRRNCVSRKIHESVKQQSMYKNTEWSGIASILFFFFGGGPKVSTQGLMLAREVLCHLRPSASSFLCWVFSKQDLVTFSPTLASNCDPPDLCLLSS
jgi:hypothetical protein